MITLKSAHEIELMRRAGKITAAARALARDMVRPGVTTQQIDKAVFQFITEQGATPSFLHYNGYPASVCVSVNDEIIHGIPGPRVLKEGDIVSVDVGAYIGGFHGARTDDPDFHRLYIRWFEYGCFCPVMRLHGNRNPQEGYGAEQIGSGSDNEIWSFGDEAYEISKKYIFLRERLRDYIRVQMKKAHEDGTPVMRPVFYDFPADQESWNVEDAYLFGPDLYVAPVMEDHVTEREVYLPDGTAWFNAWTGEKYEGGQKVTVAAPLDTIPVFVKEGADAEKLLNIFSE